LYGFNGIGTSAASDAEEMEHYSSRHGSSMASCHQHFGYRHYEDVMRVDDGRVYDDGSSWGGHGQRPTGEQYQPREPFLGGCYVHVEGIGMGATSDTFFERTGGSDYDGAAHTESYRGGSYMAVDNPDVGVRTSHSFFGDVDENGKPRGARTQRSAQSADTRATPRSFFGDMGKDGRTSGARSKRRAQSTPGVPSENFFGQNRVSERKSQSSPPGNPSDNVLGKGRGSFQMGMFEVADTPNHSSFFGDIVDGKPRWGRGSPMDQTKSAFPNRSRQPNIRPPPRATTHYSSQDNSARKTAASKNRPPVSKRKQTGKSSPSVGDRTKREVKVQNINQSSFFETSKGGPPRGGRGPSIGGDIQVELKVEFTTALYGGQEKVLVTRFEQCGACGGNGAVTMTTTCSKCGGKGLKRKTKEVKVVIPAGSNDGSMIRLEGEGDAGANGGPPGDLYVFLWAKKLDTECRPKAQETSTDETTKVEIPTVLSAEDKALLNKLRNLLDLKQQNELKGMRP
jgi:hypothetical protein